MINGNLFASLVKNNRSTFFPVVNFDIASEHLLLLDFTAANESITATVLASTESFSTYVSQELAKANAKFGIGGYNEHRTVYSRS